MTIDGTAARFDAVKIFSTTMFAQRNQLGETVTSWLEAHREIRIADIIVTQSSDSEFHCLTITIFFFERDPIPATA